MKNKWIVHRKKKYSYFVSLCDAKQTGGVRIRGETVRKSQHQIQCLGPHKYDECDKYDEDDEDDEDNEDDEDDEDDDDDEDDEHEDDENEDDENDEDEDEDED